MPTDRLIALFEAAGKSKMNTTLNDLHEWAASKIEELEETVAQLHSEKRCRACIATNPDEDCQSCESKS